MRTAIPMRIAARAGETGMPSPSDRATLASPNPTADCLPPAESSVGGGVPRGVTDERLRESEERFHHLVEAVVDYAICMLDADGFVATWNAGARRAKGYAAEEIIGQHFSVFYVPEERADRKPERVLETVRQDGHYEDEGWRVRKDGSRFWAGVTMTAIRNPDRSIAGFAKVTRDLTERKRIAEELRKSEERFRLLVEGVEDYAIYMLDPTGRITTWNKGAERMKGYSAAEIIGQDFARFFPEQGWFSVLGGRDPHGIVRRRPSSHRFCQGDARPHRTARSRREEAGARAGARRARGSGAGGTADPGERGALSWTQRATRDRVRERRGLHHGRGSSRAQRVREQSSGIDVRVRFGGSVDRRRTG
jgi:PAS domain S-box-containing protein